MPICFLFLYGGLIMFACLFSGRSPSTESPPCPFVDHFFVLFFHYQKGLIPKCSLSCYKDKAVLILQPKQISRRNTVWFLPLGNKQNIKGGMNQSTLGRLQRNLVETRPSPYTGHALNNRFECPV